MDIRLPSGILIQGIPKGTSKEDIQAKAISSGMATEEDFSEYSELEADVLAGRKPEYMLQWYKDRKAQFIKDRPEYEFEESDLGPGFFETETGQIGGGVGGGIRGAKIGWNLAPPVAPIIGPLSKPLGAIIGGAVGAGIGGGTGEGAQQIWQELSDNPYAPANWKESAERIFKAGGEEALYDFIGSTAFKSIGGIWKFIRPKEIPGIEAAQKMLSERGGQLTPSQRTDHALVGTIEGLTEVSWGGKPLRDIKVLNEDAISSYTDDYVKQFTHIAGSELDDVGVGQLFISMIESGQKAHSNTAGTLYGALDDIYKTIKPTKSPVKIPTGIVDTSGTIINQTKIIEKVLPPVPTNGIKGVVTDILKIQGEIGNASLGDYGGRIIKSISKISDDGISFAAAQELRSGLLANIRGLSGQVGEGKTKRIFADLVSAIDDAIETGAKKTNNNEFIQSWQSANKFWKEGKDALETNILGSLLKKHPEQIGDTIFSIGSVTKIKDARKALFRAVQYSKGKTSTRKMTRKELKEVKATFSNTWKRMQGGYLTNIIAKVADPETGELSIRALKTFFQKGAKQQRTLSEAFTKAQRDGLTKFVETVSIAQRRPPGTGTFMVTVQQAGLVMALYGGGTVALGQEFPVGDIATMTITPYILGKLLVNPRYARLISRGMNMKYGGPAAGAVSAKIAAAVADIQLLDRPKKQGE